LEGNNVQTRVCFAGNVTRHPVYREYLEEFENSDRIMAEGFLLGSHHGMVIADCDYVCDKIKEYFNFYFGVNLILKIKTHFIEV
jgi:CDP-6-deoxy-D-xylo-4-hexulose-3-dehydrase